MKVFILVEGQTEESFVKKVLSPHLEKRGLYLIPTLIKTKQNVKGPDYKGGVSNYPKIRKDIWRLLNDSSALAVSTMIDFYGLPGDFPGKGETPGGNCYTRVEFLESAFSRDIDHRSFIPFIVLHEFEGLLFTSPQQIAQAFPGCGALVKLRDIRESFKNPEEINEGPSTHPSARVKTLLPSYEKALFGPMIMGRIGIDAVRHECPHFDQWVTKLEALI